MQELRVSFANNTKLGGPMYPSRVEAFQRDVDRLQTFNHQLNEI